MQFHLKQLLEQLDYTILKGTIDKEITDVIYDSRKADKNSLFVCMVGLNTDGHNYILDVLKKGASVVVVERELDIESELKFAELKFAELKFIHDVTVILVKNTREALASISAAYFDYPARKMKTVGITGTKGKSTVSHMIRMMLEQKEKKCGIIGTIGAFIGDLEIDTITTTPESYELHKLFHMMVEHDCEFMIMEVSSQGIKQYRTHGIQFDIGVFTNLSPDHIGKGEHENFEEYLMYKSKLFSQCKLAIGNQDDEHFNKIFVNTSSEIKTFGTIKNSDYCIENICHVANGGDLSMSFDVTGKITDSIIVGLPGRFNVYNAMCAIAVCMELGVEYNEIRQGLEHVKVRGRIEPVNVSDDFTVLIDYAHNEISARSVLTTLREYNPNRMISIFGCGGCRSKERRYTMGETIGRLSDISIITADNPRTENVLDIIEDIKVGMEKSGGEYVEIPDRQEAVTYAIKNAKKGDMIILLGKGHEDYQEVNGVKHPYGEREAVAKAIKIIFNKTIKF